MRLSQSAYNPPSHHFIDIPSSSTNSPSGVGGVGHTRTYAFMSSIPNMIPLPGPAIRAIWDALKGLEFEETWGGFGGMEVRGLGELGAKERLRRDVEAALAVFDTM